MSGEIISCISKYMLNTIHNNNDNEHVFNDNVRYGYIHADYCKINYFIKSSILPKAVCCFSTQEKYMMYYFGCNL